ncbi:unnamed protein product [Haemonchus placei]|uniref:Guanylate cyclase domain-containing protein n=1 Tax=Haemonchus placei TaxID=6290 RepID=A0A0N4WIC1_HAEPC|nr:unnamed protein product [Haemonchus placei]
MVRIIDDYSENLESMVLQRTKTLEASLVQTENLLFHIMPRRVANVAENLRMGLPIRSEMHPSVSLLVTDICKYTELCEATIPVQVFFNSFRVFSEFVVILQCVQVENVGDLYLLASGLDHVPNHLCEVCRLSLKLLDFVEHYDIKHPSKFKLAVKIGIHSGSVASGILGSSAPRFCIFGDTVNMACRMANSSEPNKIQNRMTMSLLQMTESIAQNVRLKYPGFIIEERGSVNVKVSYIISVT